MEETQPITKKRKENQNSIKRLQTIRSDTLSKNLYAWAGHFKFEIHYTIVNHAMQ